MQSRNERPFRTLAVIGAGNMGSGIAQKIATEGFSVLLVDVDEEKVARGLGIIDRTLAEGVERKVFRPDAAKEIRARVEGVTDWSRLGSADLVVEAVFEDKEVKRQVFAKLDAVCRPDAALATNTSSFLVSDLALGTRHPERVLGLHYFYHPAKNRLVEVIPGKRTDPAIVRKAWALQEQIGKTPIASADREGFVVNRFFVPWLNEAVRCLEEGLGDIPSIEAAAKQAFGVGMGPFELMNVTGVPIGYHAATTLGEAFGALYVPATQLRAQAESGKLWRLDGAADPAKAEAIADRLRAVTFFIAGALVDEGVGTIEDTDIGARVGLRWPLGPFEMMNRLGVAKALALAESVAKTYAIETPRCIRAAGSKGSAFTFQRIKEEISGGIATLTLNRPDAMNALNEEVVAQLHDAFRKVSRDATVRGIVLAGAGKAFVAGADIRFFVKNLEAKNLDRIVSFTRAGHALLDEIDRSPKPVVARLDGLALGGGLELALACDAIVATPKAAMAFPETGIGIYPGLGGTQRLSRRVGVGLAKWLVFTGQMMKAEDAAAIGLVDAVVAHDEIDAAVERAIGRGVRPDRAERPPVPDRYRGLESFFSAHDADRIREGRELDLSADDLAKAAKQVKGKAPVALRIAETLIVEGSKRPLQEGLAMELAQLVPIFSTKDAYEGLSSLGKRPPVFEGR